MKTIAYAIAGIAALGIMIVLIVSPSSMHSSDATPAAAVTAEHTVFSEAGTLTLEIPGMHCQFACYPNVKETLEMAAGVSEVALVEQPDPDALTVKQVIVKYEPGFDMDAAMASLKQGGYDATRVQ